MHKIIFKMTSPICYTEVPVFDSIVAYCVWRETSGIADYHTPVGTEIKQFYLPLRLHPLGFYMASYMFFDRDIEGEDAWRKRWASQYDHIADFGKARRRVNIASGKLKSYDIPMAIHSVDGCWFYFDGDVDRIECLIENYILGLGKKRVMGYGQFSSFCIQDIGESPFIYCRPLPATVEILELVCKEFRDTGVNISRGYGGIRPPYWFARNWQERIIPRCTE